MARWHEDEAHNSASSAVVVVGDAHKIMNGGRGGKKLEEE